MKTIPLALAAILAAVPAVAHDLPGGLTHAHPHPDPMVLVLAAAVALAAAVIAALRQR